MLPINESDVCVQLKATNELLRQQHGSCVLSHHPSRLTFSSGAAASTEGTITRARKTMHMFLQPARVV